MRRRRDEANKQYKKKEKFKTKTCPECGDDMVPKSYFGNAWYCPSCGYETQ